MEKIFPVQISGLLRMGKNSNAGLSYSGFRLGRIEKVLDPGRFVVILENGTQVTVEGSKTLKMGNRVRVFSSADISWKVGQEQKEPPPVLNESGTLWTAFLPLGFGGKASSVRLEAFVEVEIQRGLEKGARAIYFALWTQTEKLGEIQWSIYLKGRRVSLQVFAKKDNGEKKDLENLTKSVERNLSDLGFVLEVPTVYLARPFRVPKGFRLNVKG